MQKILFLFGGFARVGGIETNARNLLIELQRRGAHTRLLCWGEKNPLLNDASKAGVQVVRSPWRWGCRLNIPDWLNTPRSIVEVLSSDVVLFGKPLPFLIKQCLRAVKKPHTKFVYITPYRPGAPPPHELKNYISQYSDFDEIWVQSPEFEQDLRAAGIDACFRTIPYMPEPIEPTAPLPKKGVTIGFLGRLVPDKNLPLLLKGFSLFADKMEKEADPSTALPLLEIAGDGILLDELAQLAEHLGIGEQVKFHGTLLQSNVKKFIDKCDMFVFTSKIEGQCLAALEILSRGRPIAATPVGAFPNILSEEKFGTLIPDDDPIEVCEAIWRTYNKAKSNLTDPNTVQLLYSNRYGPEIVSEMYWKALT